MKTASVGKCEWVGAPLGNSSRQVRLDPGGGGEEGISPRPLPLQETWKIVWAGDM